MVHIGGHADDGFGAVADAFAENFERRGERGAAFALSVDGALVVDLWGGHRDVDRTLPWERDTLVPTFSTTKGMSAVAMAVAHGRGLFDLDEPVATYWPDFAAAGKERVTVRQLLGHEAGLAVIDRKLEITDIADHDRLGAILAAQAPGWEPGTAHGYHAQSLGWYESQLLRRVDPDGRSIGRFFADEVAAPLGVEFHIGLPDHVPADRLATFTGPRKSGMVLHVREIPFAILRRMANPRSATFKAFSNPRALLKADDINDRRLLRIELPSANGTGTARAIATIYGDLATGGAGLGIPAETLAELQAPVAPSFDRIFGLDAAFSMGFQKPFPILDFGTPRAFGHTGMGGSFGFADPDRGLGYAYVLNRGGYAVPTDPREESLRAAVARCTS